MKAITILVIVGLGAVAAYFLLQNRGNLSTDIPTPTTTESGMSGNPDTDAMAKDVDENAMSKMESMEFDYQGDLIDVTNGVDVRGINTGGSATGVAKATFSDGEYFMLATFENLPDPVGDDFYEGWIVRPMPFKFISTGKLEKKDGVYTNMYASGDDLTPFIRYVLTLEPNDGDPGPADHIVEGDMVLVSQ